MLQYFQGPCSSLLGFAVDLCGFVLHRVVASSDHARFRYSTTGPRTTAMTRAMGAHGITKLRPKGNEGFVVHEIKFKLSNHDPYCSTDFHITNLINKFHIYTGTYIYLIFWPQSAVDPPQIISGFLPALLHIKTGLFYAAGSAWPAPRGACQPARPPRPAGSRAAPRPPAARSVSCTLYIVTRTSRAWQPLFKIQQRCLSNTTHSTPPRAATRQTTTASHGAGSAGRFAPSA